MCPQTDGPIVHRVEQALIAAPKGVEVILLVYLHVRLQEPHDKREEELATVLADRGVVDMIAHFLSRHRYGGGAGHGGCGRRGYILRGEFTTFYLRTATDLLTQG